MRIVKVKFLSTYESSDTYFYEDKLSKKLQKYDTVVVPTRYGVSLAVVIGIGYKKEDMGFSAQSIKSVSEKIKSVTVDNMNKSAKIKDIKSILDKKIKEIDSLEKYKMYADMSPEIAELIKSLEEASK